MITGKKRDTETMRYIIIAFGIKGWGADVQDILIFDQHTAITVLTLTRYLTGRLSPLFWDVNMGCAEAGLSVGRYFNVPLFYLFTKKVFIAIADDLHVNDDRTWRKAFVTESTFDLVNVKQENKKEQISPRQSQAFSRSISRRSKNKTSFVQ